MSTCTIFGNVWNSVMVVFCTRFTGDKAPERFGRVVAPDAVDFGGAETQSPVGERSGGENGFGGGYASLWSSTFLYHNLRF